MKRIRRQLRRLAIALLVFVLVIGTIVYGIRAYMGRVGTRELAVVTNRLDTQEPDWKWESIESARQKAAPPPEQNSAPVVLKVADLMPPAQIKDWNTWRVSGDWTNRVLSPNLPSESLQKQMAQFKESTAEARLFARELHRLPSGYYPIVQDTNPYMTLLPHIQKVREVTAILEYDALLEAMEHNPDGALKSAHAALNAARSIGDEPTLISQLVRMAGCRVSTQTALQILAWGEPKQDLEQLQAAYRAEADVPFVLYGLRGERATLHQVFEGLESGNLSADDLAATGIHKPVPLQNAALHLYKGLLPGDHAKALEILNAYIAATKLPHHERRAAFAAIAIPPGPPEDFRYILTRLLTPSCNMVATASIQTRADLLTASIAIACERFRQSSGRWPKTLAEIPKTILPEIPTDPYDGQPLRFCQFNDGIAVYSVGDANPNTVNRQFQDKDPLAGIGVGWRLWNPDKRGLPPVPAAKRRAANRRNRDARAGEQSLVSCRRYLRDQTISQYDARVNEPDQLVAPLSLSSRPRGTVAANGPSSFRKAAPL